MRGQAVGLNQLLCRTLDKVQQAQQSALEIREPGRDDELAFESIFDLELIAFRIFLAMNRVYLALRRRRGSPP
jgi:hypothetical protein